MFTDFLRERTRDLHARAEQSGVIHDVLRGKATRYSYALLLRNLLPAYEKMEAGLDQYRRAPGVRMIARRELYRVPALESDLQTLYGFAWAGSLPLLPEGEDYSGHVAAAARDGGTRLIGHAYTRYFGDLSGGPILKQLLARKLGLESRERSFYDFPHIADGEVFKRGYRKALDQAAQEIQDVDAIVAEAISAFEHNIAVSEAVQRAAADHH